MMVRVKSYIDLEIAKEGRKSAMGKIWSSARTIITKDREID